MDLKTKRILELYLKERNFQRYCFGEYRNIKTLNFASFILFIEEYLDKVKKNYAGNWQKELPPWMESCTENENQGSAPIKAYEDLIKVMTLAGAALETFTNIGPEKWRENIIEEGTKWKTLEEGEKTKHGKLN